jgi:hypothetical protein
MDRNSPSPSIAPSVEQNPYAAPQPVAVPTPANVYGVAADEPSAELFAELQRVANYRHMRKTLFSSGIGSLIFGALAIAISVPGMKVNPINVILLMIGVLLVAEGLWLVIAPVPAGIIAAGIGLMLVGIWNIFVTVFNSAHGQGVGIIAGLAVAQIVWSIQCFARYPRFKDIPRETPSPATLKRIDEIVGDINRSKMGKDPQMIQFQAKTFFSPQAWKGRLRSNHAIFVGMTKNDLIFTRPADVEIRREGKVLVGKTLKAKFQIADRSFKGTISPEAFDRYADWKQTMTPMPIPEPS